jgi:two-component system, chemotaxis family, chemotaxis protein CheY
MSATTTLVSAPRKVAGNAIDALVLDDNQNMRGIIRAILLSFGVTRVHEAGHAAEALDIMKSNQIDIAFVDYRLGDLDGLEFCRLIRNAPDSPNPFLPIIMVTAYSERTRVKEAINAGVDEFLVKPIRAGDLASRMNAVIKNRRPFVRTAHYFGPDRRRRRDSNYNGPKRRESDVTSVDI